MRPDFLAIDDPVNDIGKINRPARAAQNRVSYLDGGSAVAQRLSPTEL